MDRPPEDDTPMQVTHVGIHLGGVPQYVVEGHEVEPGCRATSGGQWLTAQT
jgi:hypothetical protein